MMQENTGNLKQKWEGDLELEISEEIWDKVCMETHSYLCKCMERVKWKTVNRYFRTPSFFPKWIPVKQVHVGDRLERRLQTTDTYYGHALSWITSGGGFLTYLIR